MFAIEQKFTGRIWPNGKFGVSRVREAPFLPLYQSPPETEESRWRRAAFAVHGWEAVAKYEGKWESVAHPDLSNVAKSPIRSKRGTKGISRYGQNLISSAAVVMERRYPRSLLSFGTVTLPSVEVEYLRVVSANWSAVVKRFVKNLRRGLKSKDLPSSVFGVTEIQEKRFDQFGVPALHLHFVFVGRQSKKSSWQVSRKNIRRWWKQALSEFLPADVDYSSVENVTGVKKSAAAYLGKYMSKGSGSVAKLIEQGLESWIPSAWYTISHELRRKVLSEVRSGENVGNFLNWLVHNPLKNWIAWMKPVKAKKKDGTEFSVGWGGRLSAFGLDSALAILI